MFDHIRTDQLLACIAQANECAASYAKRAPTASNRESCEFWSSRADLLTDEIMRRATPHLARVA